MVNKNIIYKNGTVNESKCADLHRDKQELYLIKSI